MCVFFNIFIIIYNKIVTATNICHERDNNITFLLLLISNKYSLLASYFTNKNSQQKIIDILGHFLEFLLSI